MKKAKTAAEIAHHEKVAAMGCILCDISGRGFVPASVHHLKNRGVRSSHWLVIPLCPYVCHLGPQGIHGDQTLFLVMKVTELDLLALTIERLCT